MTANSPTFPEMLRGAFNAQLGDMHVALPAQVVAYDPALQSVDVQPLIRRGYTDEQGQRAVERLPVVTHVPVAFPGAGAISMTWPIATGSTGILLFCEASLDKWLNEGGDVDPLDDRRFALTDGMFIPGLRPFSDPVPASGVHSTAVVIQAPLIHAGGSESLAFADHFHLDSTGAPTGPPISAAIPNIDFVPFPVPGTNGPPNLTTNPTHIGTSDPGTTVLKGA